MADNETTTEVSEPVPTDTKAVKGGKSKAALSTSQTPTIGRIVVYHHPENDGVNDMAAMITNVFKVENLLQVCLCVFEPLGSTFGVQGIKEGSGPGEWSWPERS